LKDAYNQLTSGTATETSKNVETPTADVECASSQSPMGYDTYDTYDDEPAVREPTDASNGVMFDLSKL
jgi:hypothetical protein